MHKYKYFKIYFEPIDPLNIGGSSHNRTYKALDIDHALKQAKKDEKWHNDDGLQVYRLTGEWRELK